MKKIMMIVSSVLVLTLALSLPLAADTGSQPAPGQPTGNPMKSQLDQLVSTGTLTLDQESAILDLLQPSKDDSTPGKEQDFSQVIKTKLDTLVSAGTLTQEQEDAVAAALKPPSGQPSSPPQDGVGKISNVNSNNGIVLKIGSPKMQVKGVEQEIDPGYSTVPEIVNGRTYIPVSSVIQSLGGTVKWLAADQSVTVALNGTTVVLSIGQKTALVNGTEKAIDAPPFISDTGRTMLPISFVAGNLGLGCSWDGSAQTITIN